MLFVALLTLLEGPSLFWKYEVSPLLFPRSEQTGETGASDSHSQQRGLMRTAALDHQMMRKPATRSAAQPGGNQPPPPATV